MTRPILIIEDDPDISESLKYNFEREGFPAVTAATGEAGLAAALNQREAPALIILDLMLPGMSGTELCRRLRREPATRRTPIIMLTAKASESDRVAGLDLGADDYITKPFSVRELLARVRTQLKRKRYTDYLRMRLEETVEMAILDPLTALHNRRYMTSHLKTLFEESSRCGKPLSVLLLDIDYFKAVNDSHGHDAGDSVLREFAARVRRNIRGIDLACRLGGEEFVVVMPDCDLDMAVHVGERLRQCIAAAPFDVGGRAGALPVSEWTLSSSCGPITGKSASAESSTLRCRSGSPSSA